MIQMGHAFARMNQSLGKNLICVNNHIKNLLSGENMNDQEPELESLSLILNALTLQLQEKIRKINNAKKIEVAFKKNLKQAFKKPESEEQGDTGSGGGPKNDGVAKTAEGAPPNVLQNAADEIV